MAKYFVGENAYFIESNIRVVNCTVLAYDYPFVTIGFTSYAGTGCRIRVRESRLYKTEEEAAAVVKKAHPGNATIYQKKELRNPYDYEF